MKKFTKNFFAIMLVLMIAISLVACGGSDAQEPSTDGSTPTPGGNIINVAVTDPQVPYDPQENTYTILMKVTDNVVESLLTTFDGGVVSPTLLTGMPTLSEDMLTYSFELIDATFHDGTPLTSEDVKYSLERVVRKATMSSLLNKVVGYDAMVEGTADGLEGIVVQDEKHFTIQLTEVYTPFASVLSTPYCAIYPKAACEAAGDTWGREVLVGTGPFVFDSYTAGVGVEVSRYDGYHGEVAKVDGLSFKFIEDPNTQVLEFQKGNVDVVEVLSNMVPVYQSDAELAEDMRSFSPIGGFYMTVNTKEIPDARVRQALSLSIDREAICSNIFSGTTTPASSFIPEGIIGHDDSLEMHAYDVEKAKALLADAGYPDGIDVRITVNSKYPTSVTIATAMQEQAKAAGIRVEVETVDSAAWTDMKLSGGITASIGNWYVDYNDPDSMLYPLSDLRTDHTSSFWHNDEFKSLMEEGVKIEDPEQRQEMYERADYILSYEDAAAFMIYNESKFYLTSDRVQGFEIGSIYRTFYNNAEIVE